MKRIKLKNYQKTNNKYVVELGNGTSHQFRTLLQTEQFLNETSKFLTSKMFECSNILSEVYSIFRQNWIVTQHQNDSGIRELINGSDISILKAYQLAITINGNKLSFIHLAKSCWFMKRIILHYSREQDRKRNDTTVRYKLKSIFDRIRQIEKQLTEYGQDNLSFFIDSSSRFSDLLTDVSETFNPFNSHSL